MPSAHALVPPYRIVTLVLIVYSVHAHYSTPSLKYHQRFLPLDVDFINENASVLVANPDPTPRIATIHNLRPFNVLVKCWTKAVYYYAN